MNVIQSLVLLGPALYVWTTPELHHWPWLLMLGLSGILTHYCLSRALAIADMSVVLPLDFLRLPFIALIAYWVWGETFSPLERRRRRDNRRQFLLRDHEGAAGGEKTKLGLRQGRARVC